MPDEQNSIIQPRRTQLIGNTSGGGNFNWEPATPGSRIHSILGCSQHNVLRTFVVEFYDGSTKIRVQDCVAKQQIVFDPDTIVETIVVFLSEAAESRDNIAGLRFITNKDRVDMGNCLTNKQVLVPIHGTLCGIQGRVGENVDAIGFLYYSDGPDYSLSEIVFRPDEKTEENHIALGYRQVVFNNDSNLPQEINKNIEITTTTTESWSINKTFESWVNIKIGYTPPSATGGVNASVEVGFKYRHKTTTSGSVSRNLSDSWTAKISVPQISKVSADFFLQGSLATIPFTAILTNLKTGQKQDVRGEYTGVQNTTLHAKVAETPLPS